MKKVIAYMTEDGKMHSSESEAKQYIMSQIDRLFLNRLHYLTCEDYKRVMETLFPNYESSIALLDELTKITQ